jgi:hypothetical protein
MFVLLLPDGKMGQQRQSVEKLFGDALEMEPEAGRAFLDAACHDEPELKHLIEQLLMEDERAAAASSKATCRIFYKGRNLRRPYYAPDPRH